MTEGGLSHDTAILLAPGKQPQLILNRLADGDCVYLGEEGCTGDGWSCRPATSTPQPVKEVAMPETQFTALTDSLVSETIAAAVATPAEAPV